MADVRQIPVVCLQIAADIGATPGDAALFRIHDPAQGPEQAGLPRAIAPSDLEALARVHREPYTPEDEAIAPPQEQILGLHTALGHGRHTGRTKARESRK